MKDEVINFSTRDEFHRKGIAQKLIKLLSSEASISTVVLDGPWGTGKTEFCKKLVSLVEEEQPPFRCVYVDAFQYDHTDDPLAMLIGAVSSLVKDSSKKQDLLQKAVPVAKVLGKVAGKAAIGWILQSKADDIGDDLAEALIEGSDEVVDEGIKKIFENFERSENDLKLYKEALTRATSDGRIVVVIDELDRCRPSFALSILEKIKHAFDIENVRFLLSTNTRQLYAMVKKQYGQEIDAEVYLSKFFSFTVHLALEHSPNSYEYFQNSFRLFMGLVRGDQVLQKHFPERSMSSAFFQKLFLSHQRSLRDAEIFYRNLTILNGLDDKYQIRENTVWGYAVLMALAVYIHSFSMDLSRKIVDNNCTIQEIGEFLGSTMEKLKGEPSRELSDILLAMIMWDLDQELFQSLCNEKRQEEWSKAIYGLFYMGHDPGLGYRFDIVKKVLRVLQLS